MARIESMKVPERVSGWTSFASIIMLVYATLLVIAGLAGIFNGDIYFRSGETLLMFNFVAWGWIHLVLGVGFAIMGIGLMRNQDWALLGGVLLVLVAIFSHIIIIATYPGWALLFLIFDALLLYALMVSGGKGTWKEIKPRREN